MARLTERLEARLAARGSERECVSPMLSNLSCDAGICARCTMHGGLGGDAQARERCCARCGNVCMAQMESWGLRSWAEKTD